MNSEEQTSNQAGTQLITRKQLLAFIERVLAFAGVPADDAGVVANCLAYSNLSGVDTHGVIRLAHYVTRLANGTIKTHPRISLEIRSPSLGIVDGDDGLGHVVTWRACDEAMKLASGSGIGAILIRNSSHFGMAGFYIDRLISQGYMGMVLTATDALLIPFGSRKPFFGSNPIAIGFPGTDGAVVLDMATTSIPYGKVALAKSEGQQIPREWGFDEDGRPTTDPNRVVGLHPIAGPKGSGLAMIIDILCSILAGMPFGPHINKMYGEIDRPRKLGHFVLAMDIDRLMPLNDFKSKVDEMVKEFNELPPADGFDRVYYPGQIEAECRARRAEKGIPIEPGLFQELVLLGEKCGVPFAA